MNARPPEQIYPTACETFYAQAELHLQRRQIEQAIELYHCAEQSGYDPDRCAGGRWICQMLAGRFEQAWIESDAIQSRNHPDPNRFWDGTPPDGKHILIRCLHGLGDTIQFVRYLPLLRQRASSVTLEAQPSLKPLLAASAIADEVITWGEPEPFWNQQIEIMELPRLFRSDLNCLPRETPYLNLPPGARTNGRISVGLVWAASDFNPSRNVPFAELLPLLEVPGVDFYSLQAGAERKQAALYSNLVTDWYEQAATPLMAAQTLQTLDLLITVDTMMAHLAGSLGIPVWTMLHYESDWRWMIDRADSPWYPTMQLIRQKTPGDWRSVIRSIANRIPAECDPAARRGGACHSRSMLSRLAVRKDKHQ